MLHRKNETDPAKRVWLAKLHLQLTFAGMLVSAAGIAVFMTKQFGRLLLTFEGTKANWQWKDETIAVVTSFTVCTRGRGAFNFPPRDSNFGSQCYSLQSTRCYCVNQ
ncbi:hypothetical protein CCR75_008999 [Bremia lactucae]|uniref:Uncharacterized protein n=1 Tax=Bremia lactucae TaxID=4779 RepID=A0A976NZL7_BRELC|nr:hypothetical protein CCR75_008999 [Bremia lactucae]